MLSMTGHASFLTPFRPPVSLNKPNLFRYKPPLAPKTMEGVATGREQAPLDQHLPANLHRGGLLLLVAVPIPAPDQAARTHQPWAEPRDPGLALSQGRGLPLRWFRGFCSRASKQPDRSISQTLLPPAWTSMSSSTCIRFLMFERGQGREGAANTNHRATSPASLAPG